MKGLRIKIVKWLMYFCVDLLRRQGVEVGVYMTTLGNEVIMIEGGER